MLYSFLPYPIQNLKVPLVFFPFDPPLVFFSSPLLSSSKFYLHFYLLPQIISRLVLSSLFLSPSLFASIEKIQIFFRKRMKGKKMKGRGEFLFLYNH